MLSQIGFLLTIGLSATGISETRTDSKGLTMRVSGTDHISKHWAEPSEHTVGPSLLVLFDSSGPMKTYVLDTESM